MIYLIRCLVNFSPRLVIALGYIMLTPIYATGAMPEGIQSLDPENGASNPPSSSIGVMRKQKGRSIATVICHLPDGSVGDIPHDGGEKALQGRH